MDIGYGANGYGLGEDPLELAFMSVYVYSPPAPVLGKSPIFHQVKHVTVREKCEDRMGLSDMVYAYAANPAPGASVRRCGDGLSLGGHRLGEHANDQGRTYTSAIIYETTR